MAKQIAKKEEIRKNSLLLWMMLWMIPLSGGYHDNFLFFLGAILLFALSWNFHKTLYLPKKNILIAFSFLILGHILVIPFSVSVGMAWTGLLRIIVWSLFLLYAMSYTPVERKYILDCLSYEGGLLSFFCILAFIVDNSQGVVNLNGRIDGLFQYANTWALYLLLSFTWLLWKKTKSKPYVHYASLSSLLLGIFFSGSRVGLVLLCLVIMIFLWKKQRKYLLYTSIALPILFLVVNAVMDGLLLFRLGQLGNSSSFYGRLLYYLDGIAIIGDNPMGIGSGGYLYLQALYQRGIYTVHFIHNEYLQFCLNGGILSGVGFTLLLTSLLLEKNSTVQEKVLVLLVVLHCFVDISMEFLAIPCILFLLIDGEIPVKFPEKQMKYLSLGLCIPFLFFALVYHLYFVGDNGTAYKLYPHDLSLAESALLQGVNQEETAYHILEQTELSMLAWDYISKNAETTEAISAKYQYLRLNAYRPEIYWEFALMLSETKEKYPELTTEYAVKAEELLKATEEKTHPFAYKIYDIADFSWKEEMMELLGETYD